VSGPDPREAYEFEVTDEGGREVWRSLFNVCISKVLYTWTLAPRQEIAHGGAWPTMRNDGTGVQPGKYFVKGRILLLGEYLRDGRRAGADFAGPESPPVPITILP